MLRDGCLYQLMREHDAVRRRTLEIMSLPLALRRMRSLVAWETAATAAAHDGVGGAATSLPYGGRSPRAGRPQLAAPTGISARLPASSAT